MQQIQTQEQWVLHRLERFYGNAEHIKHGINGLLFKFNDASDLHFQLNRCLSEKGLLKTLAKNIRIPRSFEKVAKDYMTLYNSLLS